MPYVRTRTEVRNDFPRITREIDERARQAVAGAATAGAQVAAGIASQRSKTGQMARIGATPARNTGDGWTASFASRVFYALFHEYGTLGSRTKPLKRAPRTDRSREPGTGVAPLGFMRAGKRAGAKVMREHLRRGLPR